MQDSENGKLRYERYNTKNILLWAKQSRNGKFFMDVTLWKWQLSDIVGILEKNTFYGQKARKKANSRYEVNLSKNIFNGCNTQKMANWYMGGITLKTFFYGQNSLKMANSLLM